MSIDERLRTGLADNTSHLLPDVEQELDATYARVRERRVRRTGLVAAAVAVVATVVLRWVDVPGQRDAEPVGPEPQPRDLSGVLGPLDPGTYAIGVWGGGPVTPRVVVEVPAGYFSNGGFVIDAGHEVLEPQEFGVVDVWRADTVPADPCRRGSAVDPGPTVAGLARALVRQRGPGTAPQPVVVDGHRGLAMTVTVPADIDLSRCSRGQYAIWLADGSGQNDSDPGVEHHLWILDVDGTRVIVVASLYPDQDPAQQQELIAMAESVRFVPPGGVRG